MNNYTIKAQVTVDVEISIAAENEDDARAAFEDHIMLTAGLADLSETDGDYSVYEDSISEMTITDCERE